LRSAQFTLHEIFSLFRRRKKFFFIPLIIITSISVVGALLLPQKFESSSTILVQRDEIPNLLLGYEISRAMASEDRLRTFNEILYSRTMLLKLIDSLGYGEKAQTEAKRQKLVTVLTNLIETEKRGSDSFRITFTDDDPKRAQRAVELLSKLFIETLMGVENQRGEQSVQFFEKKLSEIKEKFESSQRQVVSIIGRRINSLPTESRTLYGQLETIEKQIADFDIKLRTNRQAYNTLRTSSLNLKTEESRNSLYELQGLDIPFALELRTLLSKYDDYLRRYTAQYPEVQKIESQLPELLERMKTSIDSEIKRINSSKTEIETRKTQIVDGIRESSISEQMGGDKESDYTIYRKLYDEMKVKLEQARTSRDLSLKSANQFVIIDPPIVPITPTKPNRPMIVFGGLGISIFLGFLSVIIAELLDTTIRAPKDIEVYQKPIIAFIGEGIKEERK
jgi:uncharacterized protein involved in exopolysaccharide biosynthesis